MLSITTIIDYVSYVSKAINTGVPMKTYNRQEMKDKLVVKSFPRIWEDGLEEVAALDSCKDFVTNYTLTMVGKAFNEDFFK